LLLENRYIVCPSIPGDQRTSAEGYKKFAETLNEIGARLNSNDMVLCYHNHAFEFEDRFDGQYGLDILYENSEPQFVQAEIDTYWVQKGRVDPASYIRKYAGRAPLIHIKDMANDEGEAFAEIGQGKLNWPDIFARRKKAGATALNVEQDVCPGDPIDKRALSIENLKKDGQDGLSHNMPGEYS
jgi:sugar phosphate isomerase/epimerase